MDSSIKFWKAIDNLKKGTEYKFSGDVPLTEELFNKINWKKDDGTFTTTNPHSELTWSKVDTEIKRLQTEYDGQDYARKRAEEYPSLKEFAEAYCEKEIIKDSTKWDSYKTKYNQVRNDNPKE
tara:strand:+ start:807 stop:1175 length:369 start_codon:yes stop_codon:yes gene_type:complete